MKRFFYTVSVQNKKEYTYSFLLRGGVVETETEEMLRYQLLEIGFSEDEVRYYFKLLAAGKCSNLERLRMLGYKRKETLDQIHNLEQNIMKMDVMRSEIRKNGRVSCD